MDLTQFSPSSALLTVIVLALAPFVAVMVTSFTKLVVVLSLLRNALGLQQVRHEVGDVVAGRMHVKKSLIRRIREGKAGKVEKWAADERTISIFTAEEVYDLALKGNVLIRGWGATLLLRSVPHIACVQVCAPMSLRV